MVVKLKRVSGSDCVIEVFVGVGPSRVRDLFSEALANAQQCTVPVSTLLTKLVPSVVIGVAVESVGSTDVKMPELEMDDLSPKCVIQNVW
jgi:hypothetical protein